MEASNIGNLGLVRTSQCLEENVAVLVLIHIIWRFVKCHTKALYIWYGAYGSRETSYTSKQKLSSVTEDVVKTMTDTNEWLVAQEHEEETPGKGT